jgi:hypothetical protein
MADFFKEIGHLFFRKLIPFNSILEEETRKSDSAMGIPDVHEKRIEAIPQHLLLTLTEANVADRIEVAERISSETSPFAGD